MAVPSQLSRANSNITELLSPVVQRGGDSVTRIKPVLCYIGPSVIHAFNDRIKKFDFTTAYEAVKEACKDHFQIKVAHFESVSKIFSRKPDEEVLALLLHADCLVFDATIPPPMALAYCIGLRNPLSDFGSLPATKDKPLSYKIFQELFHPILERHDDAVCEKWAPCVVLPPEEEGGLYKLCNVTTVNTDSWMVTHEDLLHQYELIENSVVPSDVTPEGLSTILGSFFDEDTSIFANEINWSNLRNTLQMERRESSKQWVVAKSKNFVVALELTQKMLDKISRQEGDSFAWDFAAGTAEDVFYREESWGGQGRQQFQIGDWLVGDIEITPFEKEGKKVWKTAVSADSTGWITRTMQPSVFSRTYRNCSTKRPALPVSALHHCSSLPTQSGEALDETPRRVRSDLSVSTATQPVKGRRQVVCMIGVDPASAEEQTDIHSLASFSSQVVHYHITASTLDETGQSHIAQQLTRLNEASMLLDGREAVRAIWRGHIEQAMKMPGGVDVKLAELRRLESKIREQMVAGIDRTLVLELIRGFKTCKGFDEVVNLSAWVCDIDELGKGDCRVEIALEWSIALRKLSENSKRFNEEERIKLLTECYTKTTACVALFPDDETYGSLGSTHKVMCKLYEQMNDMESSMKHFQYALDSYYQGFAVSPEKYYCGINYATLLDKKKVYAANDPKELASVERLFRRTIPRICVALGKVDAIHPKSWDDYWDIATAIELAALSGEWDMGTSAMRALRAFTEHPNASWAFKSTFEQQREVLVNLKAHGLQRDDRTDLFEWWVEFYCQMFQPATFYAGRGEITFKVFGTENSLPMNICLDRARCDITITHNINTPEDVVNIRAINVTAMNNSPNDPLVLQIQFETHPAISCAFVLREQRTIFANLLSKMRKDETEGGGLIEEDVDASNISSGPIRVQFSAEEVGKRARGKRILGSGNFGTVYQAMNLVDGKQIAIKEISDKLIVNMGMAENGEYKLDEIIAEVNSMCKFQHENIVQYLGCQKGPGRAQFYIFMESMPGGSLEGLLKKITLPMESVKTYTRQMCKALQYLHRNGILHRDIKAGNVLLDQNLKVAKLADFGTSISNFADYNDGGGIGGANGSIMGFTAAFCPPEVINGNWTIDTNDPLAQHLKVDVWALGCTVMQMICSKGKCIDSAWDPYPEDLPDHEDSPSNVCVKPVNFHENVGVKCWVCALQQGKSPGLPENVLPELLNFLHLCFNPDPASRATTDRLADSPFLVGNLGVTFKAKVNLEAAGFLRNEEGQLLCDGLPVREICNKLHDEGHIDRRPFIIHSSAKIMQNVQRVRANLGARTQVSFPLNAKHSVELLEILKQDGAVAAQIEVGSDLKVVIDSKIPQAECVVNGTSHYSDKKLRDFIYGGMVFRIYSQPDIDILKFALTDDDGELLKEEIKVLKKIKVMLPSEALPPPRAKCDYHGLLDLVEAIKQESGGKLSDIFDVVGVHCRPGADLSAAAEAIQKEIALIKQHISGSRSNFSVFVSGLDGRTSSCKAFVDELTEIPSKVYVKVAEEILEESAMMVDRVLHCSLDKYEVTLSLGVPGHNDTNVLPFDLIAPDEDTPTSSPISVISYKRNTKHDLETNKSHPHLHHSLSWELREQSLRQSTLDGSKAPTLRVGVMPVPVYSEDVFAAGEYYQSYALKEFMTTCTKDKVSIKKATVCHGKK